jgi:hypothetical protein
LRFGIARSYRAGLAPGGSLFVCGRQSGLTSAPIRPHAVQTIRRQSDRITISSGSESAFMVTL